MDKIRFLQTKELHSFSGFRLNLIVFDQNFLEMFSLVSEYKI